MRRRNIEVEQAHLGLETGIAGKLSMCAQCQTLAIKVLTVGIGSCSSRDEMAAGG